MCRSPLSVAEISAYLSLPRRVVRLPAVCTTRPRCSPVRPARVPRNRRPPPASRGCLRAFRGCLRASRVRPLRVSCTTPRPCCPGRRPVGPARLRRLRGPRVCRPGFHSRCRVSSRRTGIRPPGCRRWVPATRPCCATARRTVPSSS
ncbi:hypothetical protein ACWCXL_20110 [Streptomyces sp. NPDC001588]